MNNFPVPETPFKNTDEEMEHLRKFIAEKEKHLENLGIKSTDLKESREAIAEYKRVPETKVLHPEYQLQKEETEEFVLKLAPEEHDKQITELLRIAKEKGIKNALGVLEKMQNYHLTDDFHRYISEYLREGFTLPSFDRKEKISKGLRMVLFEVLIREESGKAESKLTVKEIVSEMEQFYSSMLSLSDKNSPDNWMSLEIANSNLSDETVFYVAVPEESKSLFEKSILSVFHNGTITQKPDDYNIFNETGESAAAVASFSKNQIFPIKTYENFTADPLNNILSSFSKVNRDGEGAAIQLIWYPTGEKYLKKYKEALDKIKKGEKVKDAINIPEGVTSEFAHTVKNIFDSKSKKDDKEDMEPKTIDETAVEEISKKINASIVKCNLRLLASSNSKRAAEEILSGMTASFNVFENTLGNSFEWKKLDGKNLRKEIKNFSFRVFDESEGLNMNLTEVASVMHFQTKGLTAAHGLKQTRKTTAPAPLDLSKEGLILGKNSYRNTETLVRIAELDRLRHFYCIGQTGTGKSTLLKEMVIQDILAGNGVCMIDPHGSDIQDVLSNVPKERFNDVIYFDPAYVERPMALNMLEFNEKYPEQKTFVVNELFNIFKKLYGAVPEAMGPAFEQYFRNSALLVMESPELGNTLIDVSRVLSDKSFRQLKISKCKNPLVRQFWVNAEKTTGEQGLANYVQYVTNKFDVFLSNEIMRPVIAQEKSSFNFREIMDNQKILLVNLSKGRLGDINSNLIGLILVGKILMAALSRTDSFGKGELPPFYLYIDEFQNVTTDSIVTILSEARKYKLSLTMAHQFIAQLDEAIKDSVFGNVGTICSFRVGAEDAEYLEKQFAPAFTSADLMNIDNYNAYLRLLVNGRPAKPFNIELLPPAAGKISQVEVLKNLSYEKYGKPREEVERMILEKYEP